MACVRKVVLYSRLRKELFLGYSFPKLYGTELASSKTDQGEKEIVVPYRIQRGPTDILKALATTITKDYTAAHYKYHDDPFFIPVSNASKRSFSLSKEAGKKAARYFLEKLPHCFQCHVSVPHIPAFDPPETYKEEDDLNDSTLQACVKSYNLSSSITVYEILKKKGICVSKETEQMLLELVCFYNETPPISDDYSEERWFKFATDKQKKLWKNKGIAEKLFKDSDKDSKAYCAMIQGTAKYHDGEKAFALYEEMRSKNLSANIETYNSLLSCVPLVQENGDLRWECAMDLVSNLNRENLFPNLGTMNALLNIVSRSFKWDKGKAIAMQILAEMQSLGIEPSIGSYYHILSIFFQTSASYPSVFTDILEKVDGKDLQIQHPDDVYFFCTAMEICQKYIRNKDLAYRINALLEKGKNSTLIGNAFHESIYYQKLFKLLCEHEDFEKFMEFYQKLVPNVYTPEPSVIHEIILSAELCGAYQYLPQIGSDMVMFEHSDRENVISDFFRVAGSKKHEEQTQKPLVDVSQKLMELIEDRQSTMARRSIQWTGSMLGDLLKIFLNGEDLEKARLVLLKLKTEEASIIGYPEKETLMQLCSAFLEAKDFETVNTCVKYAVDSFYPTIKSDLHEVVKEMFECQKHSEKDSYRVNAILGYEGDEEISSQTDEKCNLDHDDEESSRHSGC